MRLRTFAVLVAGAVILAAVLLRTPQGDSFQAVHWDSIPAGRGFREVFEVRTVHGNLSSDQVSFRFNDEAANVTWETPGTLRDGQRFYVVAEAFDTPHRIEASVDGKVVWSLAFGGGSGTPVRH